MDYYPELERESEGLAGRARGLVSRASEGQGCLGMPMGSSEKYHLCSFVSVPEVRPPLPLLFSLWIQILEDFFYKRAAFQTCPLPPGLQCLWVSNWKFGNKHTWGWISLCMLLQENRPTVLIVVAQTHTHTHTHTERETHTDRETQREGEMKEKERVV